MDKRNQTSYYQLILKGLSTDHEAQLFLGTLFMLIYISTLAGNLLIIYIIRINSNLHTPMYFFLSNLSFLDICSSSVTVPKMLLGLLWQVKTISVHGCLTQLYFFLFFVFAEVMILSVMSYDRFVAICKPLHYTLIMNRKFCIQLTVSSWSGASLYSLLHTLLASRLSFCRSNIINHFFCDLATLFKMTCTDIFINILMVFTTGISVGLVSVLFVFISYSRIITAVFKIRSSHGRSSAFSTCVSHLTVVIIFYGSIFFIYLRDISSSQQDNNKVVSLLYTTMTPLLNPLIYCFRNREVKVAIKKAFRQ